MWLYLLPVKRRTSPGASYLAWGHDARRLVADQSTHGEAGPERRARTSPSSGRSSFVRASPLSGARFLALSNACASCMNTRHLAARRICRTAMQELLECALDRDISLLSLTIHVNLPSAAGVLELLSVRLWRCTLPPPLHQAIARMSLFLYRPRERTHSLSGEQ